MSEVPLGIEERLWKKDARELIGQIKYSGNVDVAKSVTNEVGYDEGAVRGSLEKLVNNAPEKYFPFVASLRKAIGENETAVEGSFAEFSSNHQETPESKKRLEELKQSVVANGEPTPEQARVIKELFPSGNYLEHSSSVRGALAIAGDPDGAIKSPEEIRKINPDFKGQGGVWGISFGMNGVDAMPGTWRHLAIFVTSPERALAGEKKSIVPYRANPEEIQVVGRAYDRELAVYAEATFDFFEKRNSLDEDSVKDDFSELERPIVYEKGKSPIERDLAKLKSGEISEGVISENYKVIDEKLIVSPEVNEQDISLGLIYADFLLKYTPEGRELKKGLGQTGVEELLALYKKTGYKMQEIEEDIRRVSEILRESMSVSLGVENTIMFVPESDIDNWLNVFSKAVSTPRLFVTFKSQEGLNVPNWTFPEGHKLKAKAVISSLFGRAGVGVPGISYEQVLGMTATGDDIIKENMGTGYLRWRAIENSKELILTNGDIEVHTPEGFKVAVG